LISELGTMKPNGYNMTSGGEGHPGVSSTDETKKKISNALKGKMAGENNPRYGVKVSDETRKKMSDAAKGKIISEQTKKKMSEAHSGERNHFFGVTGINNPLYGRSIPAEVVAKRAAALRGRILTDEHKRNISKVRSKAVIDSKSGKEYRSVKHLAEELNINYSTAKSYMSGQAKCPDWFHYYYKNEVKG